MRLGNVLKGIWHLSLNRVAFRLGIWPDKSTVLTDCLRNVTLLYRVANSGNGQPSHSPSSSPCCPPKQHSHKGSGSMPEESVTDQAEAYLLIQALKESLSRIEMMLSVDLLDHGRTANGLALIHSLMERLSGIQILKTISLTETDGTHSPTSGTFSTNEDLARTSLYLAEHCEGSCKDARCPKCFPRSVRKACGPECCSTRLYCTTPEIYRD